MITEGSRPCAGAYDITSWFNESRSIQPAPYERPWAVGGEPSTIPRASSRPHLTARAPTSIASITSRVR